LNLTFVSRNIVSAMRSRIHLDDPQQSDAQSLADRPLRLRRPRRERALSMMGPYSRAIDRGALGGLISGSSREGRYLRTYEKMLVEHIGGRPSIVQKAMICRAARMALHLELMDERSLVLGRALTQHDYQHYVAWSNSLTRMLSRLGLQPATADKAPSLSEYLSGRYGDAA
jgi:hypothetical protein